MLSITSWRPQENPQQLIFQAPAAVSLGLSWRQGRKTSLLLLLCIIFTNMRFKTFFILLMSWFFAV